jgi:predicted transcriptional regulator
MSQSMSDKKMDERITIRLDADLAKKLERWAKAHRTTKSGFVRDWLIKDLPEEPPEIKGVRDRT